MSMMLDYMEHKINKGQKHEKFEDFYWSVFLMFNLHTHKHTYTHIYIYMYIYIIIIIIMSRW